MNKDAHKIDGEVSIVLCGEAGQGIKTVESLLTRILKRAGYNVFATKEYMSRIRGGSNSTQIRVSKRRVASFVERIDILIPINRAPIDRLKYRITDSTVILGEKDAYDEALRVIDISFGRLADEVGGDLYANTIAAGAVVGLLAVEEEIVSASVKQVFSGKGEDVIDKNLAAANKGCEVGANLRTSGALVVEMEPASALSRELLVSGAEAVGMGAIAGGCNFIFSYPMSPSTGVLTFLAKHHREFGIIVEQAEDEIAAINAGLGAWYAGARAMVTTSGGGFALMIEGVSLAGMLETPMVIHVAQRPGPATGLPTRTAQEDLNLVLHAGHGEFPRIILSPGTLEDGFYLTQKAFNLADEFQVPVFILTDQFFMDSYYNIGALDPSALQNEAHIVETGEDYRRFALTDNGISPRGIPGSGKGLVCVDSDEHDEAGHITEDLDLRTKMVNKRLKKLELITQAAIAPEIIGGDSYEILVLAWGSTRNVIAEALADLAREDISLLHFSQVYPLHESVAETLERASTVVAVENNATGQFASLIELETGHEVDGKVLKYNGLPFSKEEIVEVLRGF
ncbi:MAG: 2-oxoacid:acceptor oxidoreductase subunit alpha [Candidatus Coatesbacteria bacterium]|nr:2-oxoacid:acceptor oxidoreductase subunit alpha [Candidatus Coatesbacteria bacterium]